MASTYGAITVGSTATLIVAVNNWRQGCQIVNNSSSTIYLGLDSNVTTSTGLPIVAGGAFNNSGAKDAWRGDIYGIVGTGSADIRYWEWQGG